MYKDLFAGKTSAYEDHMNRSIVNAVSLQDELASSSSVSRSGDSGQSSNPNTPEIEFRYQHFNGANGKITEVEYSYMYNGNTYRQIQCYREDIPYRITGVLDDSVGLSSGKIALWVADSLKITEHFTVKDHVLTKTTE